jgi:beta-N-acetylhexosaminidase
VIRAVVVVTAALLVTAPTVLHSAAMSPFPSPRRSDAQELRPPIAWTPIPYGRTRRGQMAAYSLRHYGERTWRLKEPRALVLHYTSGMTWQGAWETFASNARHLGELPGTCSHFLIDRDGTIHQLVALDVRCRHAIGMNHTSIGIEHVGTSDRMVLDNPAQMRSSLRLTAWLMARFGIGVGKVLGHRETLESPLRFELVRAWRCLVHADFPHPAMREYRTRLRETVTALGVPIGAGPVWVDHGC